MTAYRLYWLGHDGKIAEADWLEAASDDEAILAARSKKLLVACELWDGVRRVASIPSPGPDAT